MGLASPIRDGARTTRARWEGSRPRRLVSGVNGPDWRGVYTVQRHAPRRCLRHPRTRRDARVRSDLLWYCTRYIRGYGPMSCQGVVRRSPLFLHSSNTRKARAHDDTRSPDSGARHAPCARREGGGGAACISSRGSWGGRKRRAARSPEREPGGSRRPRRHGPSRWAPHHRALWADACLLPLRRGQKRLRPRTQRVSSSWPTQTRLMGDDRPCAYSPSRAVASGGLRLRELLSRRDATMSRMSAAHTYQPRTTRKHVRQHGLGAGGIAAAPWTGARGRLHRSGLPAAARCAARMPQVASAANVACASKRRRNIGTSSAWRCAARLPRPPRVSERGGRASGAATSRHSPDLRPAACSCLRRRCRVGQDS